MVSEQNSLKASQIESDYDQFGEEIHWTKKFLSSLWASKSALVGVIILLTVIFTAVFAKFLSPMDPSEQSLLLNMKPPGFESGGKVFWFGTDHLGRDLLSRVIYGSQVSIIVGVFSVLISGSVGLMLGLISGFYGGKIDYMLMRLVDFILSFPFILLALATINVVGPSLTLIIVVISVRMWTAYARVVRGKVLSLKESEFITAAHSIGASNWRILLLHLLPNTLSPVIIIGSLYLGRMIVIEAGLSFLGLGVPPPRPTWGGILSEGRNHIYLAWWIVTFPGIAITITVLGSNMVGDWLRNVLDPRLRARS
jgi:peptide/nickel transport system permease protein